MDDSLLFGNLRIENHGLDNEVIVFIDAKGGSHYIDAHATAICTKLLPKITAAKYDKDNEVLDNIEIDSNWIRIQDLSRAPTEGQKPAPEYQGCILDGTTETVSREQEDSEQRLARVLSYFRNIEKMRKLEPPREDAAAKRYGAILDQTTTPEGRIQFKVAFPNQNESQIAFFELANCLEITSKIETASSKFPMPRTSANRCPSPPSIFPSIRPITRHFRISSIDFGLPRFTQLESYSCRPRP
jgi:hypothetical protein